MTTIETISLANKHQWSDLNLGEAEYRLARSRDHHGRKWDSYLWDHNDTYSLDWMDMEYMRLYMVSISTGPQLKTVEAAAVMRFEGFGEVPILVSRFREQVREMKKKQLREELVYEYSLREDDEDSERQETLKMAIKDIVCYSQIEDVVLYFTSLSNGKVYIVDPCINRKKYKYEITDLFSSSWMHLILDPGSPAIVDPDTKINFDDGEVTVALLGDLRHKASRQTLEEVMAIRIQRHFRKAIADPGYAMCRKRLHDEFHEDSTALKKRAYVFDDQMVFRPWQTDLL